MALDGRHQEARQGIDDGLAWTDPGDWVLRVPVHGVSLHMDINLETRPLTRPFWCASTPLTISACCWELRSLKKYLLQGELRMFGDNLKGPRRESP